MSYTTTLGDGVKARPTPQSLEPDAWGQAALLLAESTLHGLVEAGALTTEQAVAIVRTACDVKLEVAHVIGESDGRMEQSVGLLRRIGDSMEADAPVPS